MTNSYPIIGSTPIQVTMEDVLAGYQEQFLGKILIFSLLYLIMTIILFLNVDKMDIKPEYRRTLRIFASLNLAPALYYPVLMFGIYTGWYM